MNCSSLVLLAGLTSALAAQSPQSRRVDATPRPAGTSASAAPGLPENVIFDRPSNDGELWAIGHTWKAKFDDTGMTFIPFFGSDAPQNYPIRVELAKASVGGQVLELTPGAPTQENNAVHTQRGPLVEVLDLRLRQVEQSFVFDTLPNRGTVKVDVRLQTELSASTVPGGLAFGNDHGTVWYRKAIAIDAAGETQQLDITWNNQTASIEIPNAFVERAQLPLVLDPILNSNLSLAPNIVQLQSKPDVATLQNPDRTCTVWRRRWSYTDEDCWALITNGSLVPMMPALALDFTSVNWAAPAIASNAHARNFLVVTEASYDPGRRWIRGRMLNSSGTTQLPFDIAGDAVGQPFHEYTRPDVGGDPYPSSSSFYCVVYEHQTYSQTTILARQVNQQGTLRAQPPITLGWGTRPSISKSNGAQHWLIAYEYYHLLRARFVSWNGFAGNRSFLVTSSTAIRNPSCSSPARIDGALHWALAYQSNVGRHTDIFVQTFTLGDYSSTRYNLSAAEGTYSEPANQTNPSIDSDGSRFAICYQEPYRGFGDYETLLSTVDFTPGQRLGTFSLGENRQRLGSSLANEIDPQVCAMHSGSGIASSQFQIVDYHSGRNDIELRTYGVTTRGAGNTTIPYWTSSANQCGDLTITPSGIPTLGGTMSFDAQGDVAGIIFGTPGSVSLSSLGCNCTLGVTNATVHPCSMTWTIPTNPSYLGTTLAAQAVTFQGKNCGGTIDLSDTVTFEIR